jgi:Ca2+-dependent lipid-binding protein
MGAFPGNQEASKTKIKWKTQNPVWDETFVLGVTEVRGAEQEAMWHARFSFFALSPQDDLDMHLIVWDYDVMGNHQFLGHVVVDLRPLHEQSGAVRQGVLALQKDEEHHPECAPTGTITIEVTPQYSTTGTVAVKSVAQRTSKLLQVRLASF